MKLFFLIILTFLSISANAENPYKRKIFYLYDTKGLQIFYYNLPLYYSAINKVNFPITYSLKKHDKCVDKIEMNISLIYDDYDIPIIFKTNCLKGRQIHRMGPDMGLSLPVLAMLIEQSGKKFNRSKCSVKLNYIKYY